MSDFKVNTILNPQIAGITTYKGSGMTLPVGPTEMRGGRGRMLLVGGFGNSPNNSYQTQIQRLTIATTGNSIDFGDVSVARYVPSTCASSTRGIAAGGSPSTSTIEYITIPSSGGGNDFGNLREEKQNAAGLSDSTRGVFAGGYVNPIAQVTTIDFVNIASTGNSNSFGNLTEKNKMLLLVHHLLVE